MHYYSVILKGRNVPVIVYLENIAKIGYKEKTLPTVNDGATHQDLGTDKMSVFVTTSRTGKFRCGTCLEPVSRVWVGEGGR